MPAKEEDSQNCRAPLPAVAAGGGGLLHTYLHAGELTGSRTCRRADAYVGRGAGGQVSRWAGEQMGR